MITRDIKDHKNTSIATVTPVNFLKMTENPEN